jgi:hypothetical protein
MAKRRIYDRQRHALGGTDNLLSVLRSNKRIAEWHDADPIATRTCSV